ncbi:MAG: 30S ribosomal protein S10 [Halobacteriota archaeon]|uniref:Small ribosomal subunit protein uS10 n=1 Tax=Halodesulfurarchaeum formicicum TaxID=1873524 RepID=A0A1J1ADJ4_9EURY|nr:uS10/mL48 family ribosomal protein [Halodesulfurarchaeum formicicum]APE95832.1 30S ribosomal protein S10b [Halodesulfurarchaeum formicicum]
MTTVLHLTLKSGDRETLDSVVETIKRTVRRKGTELKGPHSDAPTEYRVPLYKQLDGDSTARYDDWQYTVYQRRFELRGREEVGRQVLEWDYPESVRVEATVDRT